VIKRFFRWLHRYAHSCHEFLIIDAYGHCVCGACGEELEIKEAAVEKSKIDQAAVQSEAKK
jgi:hypothetical protein